MYYVSALLLGVSYIYLIQSLEFLKRFASGSNFFV